MAEQFYTILTAVGKAKIANAAALGEKVELTELALGDGGGSYYNPTEDQTELRNEVWRGAIDIVDVDGENPNWITIQTVVPSQYGGFMIREAGVFDDDGDLIAVGKYPETYKPVAADGSIKDLVVRMILEVSNTASVVLKIDPTVALATLQQVNEAEARAKAYTDQEVGEISQALDAHVSDGTRHAKTARFVVGTSTSGWTEKDCDYLCDGTNDQEEIRQALNALPATGGEVVILDGIYNITATISISKDNVSIRGSGNATVLKRMWDSSSPQGVITLNSVKGCRLENLQIDGNKATYTSSNNNGIHLYLSSNNMIINNTCNNNGNCGIRLYSSSNNMITGNTYNNNVYGIYLSSISDNNTITGNTYNNNDYGIYLSTSRNNMIIGNTCIRGTGTPEDYATDQHTILLSGTGNNYNLITSNNCMGKAVTVEGGTGNTVFNNKWDASDDIQNIMEAVKKHSLIYFGESATYDDGPINAMVTDDNYLYIGGGTTNNNKIYKLNKNNLSKVAESADYGGIILAIAVDNDFIYVGGRSTTGDKVHKLNKSDFSKVAESANYGGAIQEIVVDNDYIYIGGETTNKVYKLNKNNLSKVAESADYGGTILAIAVDNDFIYVGGALTNKVYKLNKNNLSKVAESADYGGIIEAIAIDDDFIYVGGALTNKVYKLNKSDFSKVAESGNYGGTIEAITVDNDFVYIGGYSTNKVYKLNKNNLSKVAESADYGGSISAIVTYDDFVYIGPYPVNKVYKLLNLVSLKN